MVVCVTTEEPRSPLILCNVCWEIVPESVIYTHLVCQKHLLQTLVSPTNKIIFKGTTQLPFRHLLLQHVEMVVILLQCFVW